MILRRIGRKTGKLANDIIACFPPQHTYSVYYEPFFGAGGIFFRKPLSQFSWLNDMDKDVINLWQVLINYKEELIEKMYYMPIHEELFKHWFFHQEDDPVLKAVRFLMLSNFSIYGKMDTFLMIHNNISRKQEILKLIDAVWILLQKCAFRSKDFREFFKDIYISDKHIPESKRFIYADPPYLDSTNPYNTNGWDANDVIDLLEVLESTKIRWAMSEYNHPFILQQAIKMGLHITDLGDCRAISSAERRSNILVTNYPVKAKSKQGELSILFQT